MLYDADKLGIPGETLRHLAVRMNVERMPSLYSAHFYRRSRFNARFKREDCDFNRLFRFHYIFLQHGVGYRTLKQRHKYL